MLQIATARRVRTNIFIIDINDVLLMMPSFPQLILFHKADQWILKESYPIDNVDDIQIFLNHSGSIFVDLELASDLFPTYLGSFFESITA